MQSDSLVVLELVVKEPDMLLWDRGKRVDERRHRGLRADHAFVQIDHRQHGHEQAGGGEQEIPQRAGEFYVCADRLVDERGDERLDHSKPELFDYVAAHGLISL